MNFLAHTLFADGNTERIVGQFCGDFVRGSDLSAFPHGIQEGILRHRRIDAYTDQHPEVRQLVRLFEPPLRRFAGIIADVGFDYCLAQSWSQYSNETLEAHVDSVHAALNQHHSLLPPDLQRFADFIQREDVLLGNRSFSAIEQTLARISRRSPRFAALAEAGPTIRQLEPNLAQCFHAFFPSLLEKERSV